MAKENKRCIGKQLEGLEWWESHDKLEGNMSSKQGTRKTQHQQQPQLWVLGMVGAIYQINKIKLVSSK